MNGYIQRIDEMLNVPYPDGLEGTLKLNPFDFEITEYRIPPAKKQRRTVANQFDTVSNKSFSQLFRKVF